MTLREPLMSVTPAVVLPRVGALIEGYQGPVIDERAVRIAAGLLLMLGLFAATAALAFGTTRPLQMFGMFFLLDMLTRLLVSDRLSITLALGRLASRSHSPRWVGAPQKAFAWWLAVGIATVSCVALGSGAIPLQGVLALCGVCFTLLALEAIFGWCAGCHLHRRLSRHPTHHCADRSCNL